MYVRLGMFLHNIDAFDPSAFRLTAAEASAMDPQQRLLLEQTSTALTDASSVVGSLADTKTGVYVGCMYQEYTQMMFNHGLKINPAVVTGNGISYLVGRLSYTFGLAGPCVSTDTACSSSLVATHQAHKGLLAGETVAAVAAGVNAMVLSITTASIAGMGALSPVARCKTFDASADGYGRGEGFAVFILAPGQFTQGAAAIIRGSAINQDGRSSGLTAPNGPSQTTLIRDVMMGAGVQAEDVSYMAMHGTGTPLGDPIEINALGQAFRQPRGSTRPPLTLGSVKSCYGHTEGAAGLTGALLALHALHDSAAPAVMHLRNMNPYVDSALGDWQKRNGMQGNIPRQFAAQPYSAGARSSSMAAGTSSFGMGGTNTHLLLAVPLPKQPGVVGAATNALFQRTRLWPAPSPSHFLTTALAVPRTKTVIISINLLRPVLESLFDHRVQGHVLLPGAALFDVALSSARVLDKTGSNGGTAVALQSSILAPVPLSSQEKAMQLNAEVSLAQGALSIRNFASGAAHFNCKMGRFVDVTAQNGAASATKSKIPLLSQLLSKASQASFAFSTGSVAVNVSADPDGYCLPPAIFDSCLHAGAALAPIGAEVRVPTGAAAVSGGAFEAQKLSQMRSVRVACSVNGLAATSSYMAHSEIVGASSSRGLFSITDLEAKAIALKPSSSTPSAPIFASSQSTSVVEKVAKPRPVQYAVQLQASTTAPVFAGPFSAITTTTNEALHISLSSVNNISSSLRIASMESSLSVLLSVLQQGAARLPAGSRVGIDSIGTQSAPLPSLVGSSTPISTASAWGMARVAASEIPAVKFAGVDVAAEAAFGYRGGSTAATDLSGDLVVGGAMMRPLLLPVDDVLPSSVPGSKTGVGGRVFVTGGLGGIGVLVAVWLTNSNPAQEIVLLGRSGTFTATPPVELLMHKSAVTALCCDATAAEDVHAAFTHASSSTISGVFHAGGLLQDGILMKQTASGVRRVLGPKITFLSHAAQPTTGHPVHHINLFASVSGFLGSPGQANYAAANAGLDYWAEHAQRGGITSSSVQWGAWAEVGMAHGNAAVLTRVEKSGLGVVYPGAGLKALENVLLGSTAGRLVQTIASPFDFSLLLKGIADVPSIFNSVVNEDSDQGAITSTSFVASSSAAATAPLVAIDLASIAEDISQAVSTMLGTEVTAEQPLMEAGLDSLAAVELRNELGTLFSISMPATVMFDYPTISALAGFVASKSRPIAPSIATVTAISVKSGEYASKSVVVLSMSCRYPQSIHSMESFSSAAHDCMDLPQVVPWTRFDIERMYSPVSGGQNSSIYARFGAFIENVEQFDGQLFGLPRAEALAIDPQQRLLLEETHGALVQLQGSMGTLQGTDTGKKRSIFLSFYFLLAFNS